MTDVRRAIAGFAATAPDSVALRAGAITVTYAELDTATASTTAWLQNHGVGLDDRVIVLLPRGPSIVSSILGVLGAEAAFVPLDYSCPSEHVSRIVRDCTPRVIITDRADASHLGVPSVSPSEMSQTVGTTQAPPDVERVAYVLYTSGSTGEPKGVVVGSRAMHRYLDWAQRAYGMAAGSGAPLFTSIGFDATLTSLFGPLLVGRSLTIVGEDDPVLELAEILRGRPDFSFVKATPHHVRLLADLLQGERLDGAVRRLVVGGDTLDGHTVRAWSRIFETPVVNEYGPTETVVACTAHTVLPHEVDDLGTRVPIGVDVAGARVQVMDDAGELAPNGHVGELYICGPSADNYYLGRPGVTAASFVPDPHGGPGARRYRTGDLASVQADGALAFHGRSDRQVKVRGYRVELGEVEAAVRATPGVVDAAAILHPTGQDVILAVVYTGSATADAVRSDLVGRVASWVVPGRIVRTDVLPATVNAKADLAAMAALLDSAAGPADRPARTVSSEPLTATLQHEFGAVLSTVAIESDSNFFRCGGNSMSAIRLVARLRRMGYVVTPADLVASPTPDRLARLIEPRATTGPRPAAVKNGEEVTLTPAQRDFLALDLPVPGHWNQVRIVSADAFDGDRLRAALDTALTRHDVLRYRFSHGRQVHVGGAAATEFSEITIDAMSDLDETVRAANRGLNLERGPLARWVLVHVPDAPDHLVLVAHHLIVDEISWHVLLDDIAAAYRGAPETTVPASGGFAAWRKALDRFAQRPEVLAQQRYWSEVLARPVGEVVDPSGTATDDYADEHYLRDGLDAPATALIRRAAESARVEMHELLLGAVVASLGAELGIRPPRVDVETHGRLEMGHGVDASRVMGWCTAIFPVALRGDTSMDLVDSARREMRALPWHGTEFGLLRPKDHSAPSRTSRVLFNYMGDHDGVVDRELGWRTVRPVAGAQSPTSGHRPYALELQASTVEDRLEWEWRAGSQHPPALVRALSRRLRDTLADLADSLGDDARIGYGASGLSRDELAVVLAYYETGDDGSAR